MMTKFILLTTQRTGSTWAVDMLNSHPHVVAYSELLLQDGKGAPKWGGAKNVVFWNTYRTEKKVDTAEALLFQQYLDDVFSSSPPVEAVGFKVMYGQAGAHPQLHDYVRQHGVRVIHLIRRNVVDLVLSRLAAVASDIFHTRETNAQNASAGIHVPPNELLRQLNSADNEIATGMRFANQLDNSHPTVFYEDLSAVGSSSFRDVLSFLGVTQPDLPLSSTLQKILPTEHRQLLSNYEEVKQALSGTKYEQFVR